MNDRPWLAHYDPGVAHTLQPYPDNTLNDFVAESAVKRPNATAIRFQGATLTWYAGAIVSPLNPLHTEEELILTSAPKTRPNRSNSPR